ncbi:hypothetical protein [Enterococcus casseliflavus]|uniref:hypothetical protein n=1 Tax=Enterococcus casseliflavus TaxID=37734 RepID=UPI0014331E76|nr:hypothetical protein [Enterococcus casseliflavus]NKD31241.1 hypothetical protein [Enterococcus casseliflavus]
MDRRIIFLASTYVVLGMVKVPLAFPHTEHSFGSQVNIVKNMSDFADRSADAASLIDEKHPEHENDFSAERARPSVESFQGIMLEEVFEKGKMAPASQKMTDQMMRSNYPMTYHGQLSMVLSGITLYGQRGEEASICVYNVFE